MTNVKPTPRVIIQGRAINFSNRPVERVMASTSVIPKTTFFPINDSSVLQKTIFLKLQGKHDLDHSNLERMGIL